MLRIGAALWHDAGLIRSAEGLRRLVDCAAPARPRDRSLRARAGGEPRRPLPRGLPGRERRTRRAPRRPPFSRPGAGAMELTQEDIERVVAAALAEDVGSGDATTLALVPEDARCRAELLLEEPGVVCGVQVAACRVPRSSTRRCEVEAKLEEGTRSPTSRPSSPWSRGRRARSSAASASRSTCSPALRHRVAHPPLRRADRGNPHVRPGHPQDDARSAGAREVRRPLRRRPQPPRRPATTACS